MGNKSGISSEARPVHEFTSGSEKSEALFINNKGVEVMAKKYEMTDEEVKAESRVWSENLAKGASNWRSWGSWFSWGSPVGLGLFFIEVAVAVWIFAHLGK